MTTEIDAEGLEHYGPRIYSEPQYASFRDGVTTFPLIGAQPMTPTDTLREAVARKIGQYTYARLLPETSDCEEWDQMDDADRMIYRIAADAALSAIEAAGWRVVNEAVKLPCSVQLPPATNIGAGCRLGTLIDALEHRGMSAPRLDATVRSGEEG